MLAKKQRIIMVWSPDPERLNNKETLSGNTRLSLGIDFVSGLGVGGVRNKSDQIGWKRGRKYREK